MADGDSSRNSSDERKARLAAELRANLKKRKEQARSRRAGEADSRVGLGPEEGGSTAGKDGEGPRSLKR